MQEDVVLERLVEDPFVLRTIIAVEPVCVLVLDQRTRPLLMNEAGLALIEAEALRDVINKPLIELVKREYRDAIMALVDAVFAGRSGKVKFELVTLKQSARWCQMNAVPLRDRQGAVICLLGVTRDITEARKTSSELKQSEALFRTAFENANIGIAFLTPDGFFLKVNRTLCDMIGYSCKELLFRHVNEVALPENIPNFERQMESLLSGAVDRTEFENAYRCRDGRVVWAHLCTALIRDKHGRPEFFITTIHDITEKKRAEDLARDARERFMDIVQTIDGIVWEVDAETFEFEFVSQKAERLLGYPIAMWLHNPTFWRDHTHPDDREAALEYCRNRTRKCEDHEFEYRMIAADGRTVWLRDYVRVCTLPNGNRKLRGVMVDITAQKRDEAARRESDRRLRALIDNSPDAISFKDPRGAWMIANAAQLRLFELEHVDYVGKTDVELAKLSPFYGAALGFCALTDRQALEKGETFRGEEVVLLRDGSQAYFDVIKSPIHDANGRIEGLAAVGRDITDRKRSEEKLKASLREKEVLLKEIHHRVKNNLQLVSSLLNLQSHAVTDVTTKSILNDCRDRVHSMALIHQKLYQAPDLSHIRFDEYVRELLRDLWASHNVRGDRIRMDFAATEIVLDVVKAVPCGLIINELVNNAIKHGFPGNRSGRIAVRLTEAGGDCQIEVRDDGVGVPPGVDVTRTKTLGMPIVLALVGQLSGRFEWESRERNTVFRVLFRTRSY